MSSDSHFVDNCRRHNAHRITTATCTYSIAKQSYCKRKEPLAGKLVSICTCVGRNTNASLSFQSRCEAVRLHQRGNGFSDGRPSLRFNKRNRNCRRIRYDSNFARILSARDNPIHRFPIPKDAIAASCRVMIWPTRLGICIYANLVPRCWNKPKQPRV